jgi:integrase
MASIRKRSWTTSKGEKRTGWTVDFLDAQGMRQRRQFDTRREADDFRVSAEGQLRTGTFRPEAAKFSVQNVADLFLSDCERRMQRKERMTRTNYVWYVGIVRNYICPDAAHLSETKKYRKRKLFAHGLGGIKLAQLTARAVSDFRDHLRDEGLSVTSTRKILGLLKLILNYAIARDLLAINVAQKVKVIGRRDEGPKKVIPPTKEAMKRLIAVASPDFRVKLIFAAMTGLRAGEFHALRWRHLDLGLGEVTVETRVDRFREEDVTKTAAGMRTVPLGRDVVGELKAWKLRAKRTGPDDIVFPNKRGWYENHDNMIKRDFDPLFAHLAELHRKNPNDHSIPPFRFNWHALRHFAISCWIDAGLKPKTIQTFAGHATLAITMDRYGHLFKSDAHKEAMDDIAAEFVLTGSERPKTPANLRIQAKELMP